MTTPEVRSSIKWSAIRSKAVPSNVVRPAANAPVIFTSAEISAKGKKDIKARKDKTILPATIHKAPAFAGSTGSSHSSR